MRINTYNMVSQIYGSTNNKKSNAAAKNVGYTDFTDQVNVSSIGRDMQIAKNALKGVQDVRTDLVNDIKQRVDSGSYEVSGEDFAAKLMSAFAAKNI